VRAQAGYGGAHLTWKYGDTVKWLPPEKFPADAAAASFATLPKTKLQTIYYLMVLGSIWENGIKDVQLAGKDTLFGIHHGAGQEADQVGVGQALKGPPNPDLVACNMRHHALGLAMGQDVNVLSAGIWGKTTGATKGYASYRQSDVKNGFYGPLPLIGLGWNVAAGLAWSCKVRKAGQVALGMNGDGGCATRYMFSAVRSSVNYKLPVVWWVANNFQAMALPAGTTYPSPYIADMPAGLGLPCSVVDGNNVAQTYTACKEAADLARSGGGPSVVESLTWRWYDHSGNAGAKIGVDGAFGLPYRTDDEVRAWLSRDPKVRYANWLLEKGLFTQAELDAQKTAAQKAFDDSVAFARAGPLPNGPDGNKGMWPDYVAPAMQFFEHTVRTT
jgi:pyruvate dehydrogenase E1 component alpha subunit